MIDVLKGERVNLRDMEEKDWVDVHKYASQEKVCQYQPWGAELRARNQGLCKTGYMRCQKGK